ncbi:MAG: ABC transporter substrate-binding protein [Armatimonadetes bacterium]|nr:ABC transporter substrate-binding protein [Armatimonadota bacterium]
MRRATLACLPLLAVLGIAGCSALQSDAVGLSGNLRFAALVSLSGLAAPYGPSQRNGINLAVEQINGSRFLGSATLQPAITDDQSSGAVATAAMAGFVADPRVLAVLGPTLSATALAADPTAQAGGLPVLGISNTANGIVEIGSFIFRDSLPESSVQPRAVQVSHARLGYTRAAIIAGDDTFSLASRQVFRDALLAAGVTIVADESFHAGDLSYAAQFGRIAALNPAAQVVVLCGTGPDTTRLLVQARGAGITAQLLGGNGFNSPAVLAAAGAAAEGLVTGAAWHAAAPTPGNAAFVAAYTARFRQAPDQFAAQAYTGVYLLAHALRESGAASRLAVRNALARLSGIPTVLGSFSFAADRNPVCDSVVQTVQGGSFVLF